MKFKQFKKEISQDSDLLKLSGKDLAAIFEIDVLKAKYFKKRYKEELQFAVEFDINDTKWFDTLVNQSSTSKPKDWVNSDTYIDDWTKAINYGTDNLKPNELSGQDLDGDILKGVKVDFSDLKRVFHELEDKHFKREKSKSKVGDTIKETKMNYSVPKPSIFEKLSTEKGKAFHTSELPNDIEDLASRLGIDLTADKYNSKNKLGNIIETNCTCPVCKESIVLETFNSGKNLTECPECYTLLLIEDNVIERFTGELPKSNVSIESLMNDINKIGEENTVETFTFTGELGKDNFENEVIYCGDKLNKESKLIQINFTNFNKFFCDLDFTQFKNYNFRINKNITPADKFNSTWVTAVINKNNLK